MNISFHFKNTIFQFMLIMCNTHIWAIITEVYRKQKVLDCSNNDRYLVIRKLVFSPTFIYFFFLQHYHNQLQDFKSEYLGSTIPCPTKDQRWPSGPALDWVGSIPGFCVIIIFKVNLFSTWIFNKDFFYFFSSETAVSVFNPVSIKTTMYFWEISLDQPIDKTIVHSLPHLRLHAT